MGRKTAIITGANRGVGRGVANVFAEKGYDLFLAYNGETEKAKEVQQYVTEKYGVFLPIFRPPYYFYLWYIYICRYR